MSWNLLKTNKKEAQIKLCKNKQNPIQSNYAEIELI